MASEILGRAFFSEGKYPQCFSLFGGERRGAPVTAFLRVDDKPILLKCQIKRPDHLILFDLSLVDSQELSAEVKPGGILLVNTGTTPDTLPALHGFKVGLIDAASIAREKGLGETFNVVMLGAYAALTQAPSIDSLAEAVKAMVPGKVEANVEALRAGFEGVKSHEREEPKHERNTNP